MPRRRQSRTTTKRKKEKTTRTTLAQPEGRTRTLQHDTVVNTKDAAVKNGAAPPKKCRRVPGSISMRRLVRAHHADREVAVEAALAAERHVHVGVSDAFFDAEGRNQPCDRDEMRQNRPCRRSLRSATTQHRHRYVTTNFGESRQVRMALARPWRFSKAP
eukprot:scaffold1499_cov255-Pinguiococcus_pyrenoidosus.AAC.3